MSPTLGVYAMTRPASQLDTDGTGDWRVNAACGGRDYPFFGPEHEHSSARVRRQADAVDICQGCPVISACLTAALEAEGDLSRQHRFGVVGGMTPTQRHALSRGEKVPVLRRPKPKPVPAPRPPRAPQVDRDDRPRPADCTEPSEYGVLVHRRKGERSCAGCSAAKVTANRARRAAARGGADSARQANPNARLLTPRPEVDCAEPSVQGALRHYRKREQPCRGCAAAKAADLRARRAATRATNDQRAATA